MQKHTPSNYSTPSPAYDTQFYDAYGVLRQDYGLYSTGAAPAHTDPVGFGGQWGNYTDTETGLLCLTHRYYDPGIGRFINRDPIDYAGGINLYGYAGNNPVNEMDPSGLRPLNKNDKDHLSHIYKFFSDKNVIDTSVTLAKINAAVGAVKTYIGTLPTGSSDPANLSALYWAIGQLGNNWGVGHTAKLPGFVDDTDIIQCNYFIAGAYIYGAGVTQWPGKSSIRHPGLSNPISANDMASRVMVDHTKLISLPRPGDIVAFHSLTTNGHTSLFVGGDLLIYAGGVGVGKINTFNDVMADGHDLALNRKYVP